MHVHSIQVLAGFTSSAIFISSNLPMLFKAFKTKDLSSYSLGHLALGNQGNTVCWLYVSSLPIGPVWFLQGFFSTASALMLFCYLRYEKKLKLFQSAGHNALRRFGRMFFAGLSIRLLDRALTYD